MSSAAVVPPAPPVSQADLGAVKAGGASRQDVDIIDIRRAAVEMNLKEEIPRMLRPDEGPRKMPTLLLYSEKGLQLFEQVGPPGPALACLPVRPWPRLACGALTRPQITYLEEYYLTNYEIQVLRRSAADIARAIPAGALLVELGSG